MAAEDLLSVLDRSSDPTEVLSALTEKMHERFKRIKTIRNGDRSKQELAERDARLIQVMSEQMKPEMFEKWLRMMLPRMETQVTSKQGEEVESQDI